MPVARPESSHPRIIAHVDMDCFYVQVEQRKKPELRGLPSAVVQYNEWKGGGLIAVSYEARGFGVKRSMRGDEAKQVCPEIHLVQVPVARGKADLGTYRNAGSEVVSILARKGRCERASIDEVYLDLTDAAEAMLRENPPESLDAVHEEAIKSHVLGIENKGDIDKKESVKRWLCNSDAEQRDRLLACGAVIVAELRMQVLMETEFTCSAGIAHNKMLAKLASAMNKPAQQTVVPFSSVNGMLYTFPIKKMKQLGGKLGTSLQSDLGVNTVGDLLQFHEEKLQDLYGVNTGTWLWNIARGISGEEVQGRLLPKSHGSGKSFPGPRALKTAAAVQHWLNQLCDELSERICRDLEENKRTAHTLTLHATTYGTSDRDSHRKFPSKSCPLRYGTAKLQEDAFNLFQAGFRDYLGTHHPERWGITGLSVSASKIMTIPSGTCSITKYFGTQQTSADSPARQTEANFIQEAVPSSPSGSKNYTELECCENQVELQSNHSHYQEDDKVTLQEQEDKISSLPGHVEDSSPRAASQPHSPSQSCSGKTIVNTQEFTNEDARVQSTTARLKRKEQRKKNGSKDQGTILRFFKSNDHVQELSQSVGDSRVGSSRSAEQNDGGGGGGTWSYKIDEIDESVIAELPKEIQAEIETWIRPHKRSNVSRRGATIAHYFSASQK